MTKDEMIILAEPQATYEKEYTYADYLTWQFDEMVELIRGRIFRMSPAPTSFHQKVSAVIFGEIYGYLKNKNCNVFAAPFDVILPIGNKVNEKSTTVVQPDICVICDTSIIKRRGCFGAPDLIVEILSPSTSKKDLINKYEVYEESGVLEYWIVYPLEKMIQVHQLENGSYKRKAVFQEDDLIESTVLKDFSLSTKEVFKGLNEN